MLLKQTTLILLLQFLFPYHIKPIDFDNAPLLRFTYKSGKQFNQSLSASAGLKFATKALLIGTDLIFSYNIGDIIKEG